MRTQDEIIARITARKQHDPLGFEIGELIVCLPFDAAKPWLKDTAKPEEWKADSAAEADVEAKIRDYMSFAWEKANNCRGISAGRSIAHMQAWLWLLGEDAAAEAIGDYSLYGKPQLAAICERFGIDWRSLDSGEWVNEEYGPDHAPYVADVPFRAREP